MSEQQARQMAKKVAMLREVAYRILTEHERLAMEARTVAIQLMTLEQELAGGFPIACAPTPGPSVVPLRM